MHVLLDYTPLLISYMDTIMMTTTMAMARRTQTTMMAMKGALTIPPPLLLSGLVATVEFSTATERSCCLVIAVYRGYMRTVPSTPHKCTVNLLLDTLTTTGLHVP